MIKSRFYLIKGDGTNIYVGYTNRPIRQRFAEHKKDKDFSQYSDVTIEQIDQLNYDFTWDEQILYRNAEEVSIREGQLILQYNTQDSEYQRADAGGQTWAFEKWFVSYNKDNPKFANMSEKQVEKYIQDNKSLKVKIYSYIKNTQNKEIRKLKGYIGSSQGKDIVRLKNYISSTLDEQIRKLKYYIGNTLDKKTSKLKKYIGNTQDKEIVRLKNYISITKDKEICKLKDYIKSTQDKEIIKLKSYISSTQDEKIVKLKNYIGNTKKKEE